jgi:diaminopimelate decarboxylase
MLNNSFHYRAEALHCDAVSIEEIAAVTGTPVYIYSLKRALENYNRLASAFAPLNAHIHYSAKANANLALLRALISAGAGIDCVSGGEIHKALLAGCPPEQIVFAGVGKTPGDLSYAVEQHVGWVNIENEDECRILEQIAAEHGRQMHVALRYNPDIAANTIRQIATGHGGAKFGLTADAIHRILSNASDYPSLRFEGIHIHIGSQLGDTSATRAAIRSANALIAAHPQLRTLNIGGGFPAAYRSSEVFPDATVFAEAIASEIGDRQLIIEPGRSIVADAGILVAQVLYVKEHGGQKFVILDAGMTDLMRPALYDAHHEIVPVRLHPGEQVREMVEIVGPVCETTDTLASQRLIAPLKPGDRVAILTTGAYGFVMASTYNARPRPPEVVISSDGSAWQVARQRETWEAMTEPEL